MWAFHVSPRSHGSSPLQYVVVRARRKMCCGTLQRAANDRQVARRVRSDRRGRAEDQARLPRRRCACGSWRRRERARCSTGMAGQRARPAVGRRRRSGGCCKRISGRSRTRVRTHEPAAIAASSAIMRLCASVCVRAPGAGACACQWQRACAFARDKGSACLRGFSAECSRWTDPGVRFQSHTQRRSL